MGSRPTACRCGYPGWQWQRPLITVFFLRPRLGDRRLAQQAVSNVAAAHTGLPDLASGQDRAWARGAALAWHNAAGAARIAGGCCGRNQIRRSRAPPSSAYLLHRRFSIGLAPWAACRRQVSLC